VEFSVFRFTVDGSHKISIFRFSVFKISTPADTLIFGCRSTILLGSWDSRFGSSAIFSGNNFGNSVDSSYAPETKPASSNLALPKSVDVS
jgi:hypothetical protein